MTGDVTTPNRSRAPTIRSESWSMLTWQDYLSELPPSWAEQIAEQCQNFQKLFRTEPVKAAEAILELDRLWREFEDTDHLTPLIARLLNPRSPRGCHDDTHLSYQAWWLAQGGMHNSARVLLETFQPENCWAQLAKSCLTSTEQPLPRLKSYRGKLRQLVEQIRRDDVADIIATCQANPRSFLADSRNETVAFELACAGYADLADEVWRLESDWADDGLSEIVHLYQRLGQPKEARRLFKQTGKQHWEAFQLEPPITNPWEELEAFATAKSFRGFQQLLQRLLDGFPKPKRLVDPASKQPWIEETPKLRPVCLAAWRALQGLEWSVALEGGEEPSVIAGWANLCERTGRNQEALELRNQLPPSWETYYAEQRRAAGDRSAHLFLEFGRAETPKFLAERERIRHLQSLLEDGKSKEAIELANPVELLNIAQILEPTDDWDLICARTLPLRPSGHKIRLLLLLGRALRTQGRLQESQKIFEAVPQAHPQPIKICGGDPIPPFFRPIDIAAVAATVLECLDPDKPEPLLTDYLLELPTSQVLLQILLQLNNLPPVLEHYQGQTRPIIESLVARFADFPYSSQFAIGHLAWLHPHAIADLEKLLVKLPTS